jgi:hypothetical protein
MSLYWALTAGLPVANPIGKETVGPVRGPMAAKDDAEVEGSGVEMLLRVISVISFISMSPLVLVGCGEPMQPMHRQAQVFDSDPQAAFRDLEQVKAPLNHSAKRKPQSETNDRPQSSLSRYFFGSNFLPKSSKQKTQMNATEQNQSTAGNEPTASPAPAVKPEPAPAFDTAKTEGAEVKREVPQVEGFWDQRVQQGRRWTNFTAEALEEHGQALLTMEPKDIKAFCPAYSKLGPEAIKSFWVHLISAMAFRESTFRPELTHTEKFTSSNGQNVISRGLLQLSHESVLQFNCGNKTAKDLHDPQINLTCGVKVLNRWVSHDGVITGQVNGKWIGGARYWAVLRSSKTLKAIRTLMGTLEFCKL